MMIKAPKRWIPRLIHLIFSIPIIGYVYSPFEELPNYAPVVRLAIPALPLRDFGCGKAMSFDDSFRRDRPNTMSQTPSRLAITLNGQAHSAPPWIWLENDSLFRSRAVFKDSLTERVNILLSLAVKHAFRM